MSSQRVLAAKQRALLAQDKRLREKLQQMTTLHRSVHAAKTREEERRRKRQEAKARAARKRRKVAEEERRREAAAERGRGDIIYETTANQPKSYATVRAALNELDTQGMVRRIPVRRGANGAHWIPQQGEATDQTWEYPPISSRDADETRSRLAANFPRAKYIMGEQLEKVQMLLDQGSEGACTFVGFLNCSILSRRKQQVAKAASQTKWATYWRQMSKEGNWPYGSPDIASTLDAMLKLKILDPRGLNYVPIRSGRAREIHYNVAFWVDEQPILAKYGITAADYRAAPFVYQNLNVLETLVDRGIPVAVNAMEHTRTLVGYNGKQFLFADNWGSLTRSVPVFVDEGYATLKDEFAAGYSTITKWAIATNVRDIAFWNVQG